MFILGAMLSLDYLLKKEEVWEGHYLSACKEVSLASWQESLAEALACYCEAPATAPPGPRALSTQLSRAAQTPASLRQMERPASETEKEERGGRVAVHTDVWQSLGDLSRWKQALFTFLLLSLSFSSFLFLHFVSSSKRFYLVSRQGEIERHTKLWTQQNVSAN